jgi:recombinational DNA repair ATPase RecF
MDERNQPTFIHSLLIQGFRAYLQPKTFDFTMKRSLAVFAPNAGGKSSTVDALEFMFSDDGTLKNLGTKAVHNKAGPDALAHYLAKEQKLTPEVVIKFQKGKTITVDNKRNVIGKGRMHVPQDAKIIKTYFFASPIIRGYALRQFVEGMTPEDRYIEVAKWLQLDPLVVVQKNLRKLLADFKNSAEDNAALTHLNKKIASETMDYLPLWDTRTATDYINEELLAPLDSELKFESLNEADQALLILKERAKDEEHQLGLSGLRNINKALKNLYSVSMDENTNNTTITGLLNDFDQAINQRNIAIENEANIRNKTANALFSSFWETASLLFENGMSDISECPLCCTPISNSSAGSVEGIRTHITTHLTELQAFSQALKLLNVSKNVMIESHKALVLHLDITLPLLEETYPQLYKKLSYFQDNNKAWIIDNIPPDWLFLVPLLLQAQASTAKNIEEIERRQGENTYVKALSKIEKLLSFKKEHDDIMRLQKEKKDLLIALRSQSSHIDKEIRKKVQSLINFLQEPVNEIYREIQGKKATPIKIELPPENDLNQQRLFLLIDFSHNRKGVQPSGYLSDSQIHSLALSLRLAAIKQFNTKAPIVALDDIVTSYDANHRRSLAKMLNIHFANFQVIVMTHDKRYFTYLKETNKIENWQYLCITELDHNYGPRFTNHKVTDEMIEQRLCNNESVANDIRQAEEEWLLQICQNFVVYARIRTTEEAYTYSRSELAEALQRYLKENNMEPPMVPGINQPFLDTLQRGNIENFGSHHQSGEYGDSSIGDERERWEEFKYFRDRFLCSECQGKLFKRSKNSKKPICANDSCGIPFKFST